VIVTGEDDAPIVGAHVVLAEVGDKTGSQITDEVGQVFWNDLPGETISLSLSAQGYFPLELTQSIERGITQLAVPLERDPHGLLPAQACGPGEKLLYIEDFQDGEAQGWEAIKHRAGGWDIGPHPDSQGNTVLLNASGQDTGTQLIEGSFDSAVWRIQFMTDGKRILSFNWRNKGGYEVEEGYVDFSAYGWMFDFGAGGIAIFRTKWPISNPTLLNTNLYVSRGTWHQVEMSTYEGRLEVWFDGRRLLVYEDPEPLPSGTIDFSFEESPTGETITYFDNISVCELSAPYIPMPTPES
jgi:hypothetical protein